MPNTNSKPLLKLTEEQVERFWSKVDKRGPDDCWPWTAGTGAGYGSFKAFGRNHGAHRYALFLATGKDPAPGIVRHMCEGRYAPDDITARRCCNPAHLLPGTLADNARDKSLFGRAASGDRSGPHMHPERMARGDRHGSRTHPERVPRGNRSRGFLHPESYPRGDKSWSHLHPERLARGERNHKSKMTADSVIEMRRLHADDGLSYSELGRLFNVSNVAARLIVLRKSWTHI